MAATEYQQVLDVNLDHLFSTIVRYEDYPQFVEGCKSVTVHRDRNPIEVEYRVEAVGKEIEYRLRHWEEKEKGLIHWELLDSNFFKKNTGSWKLVSQDQSHTDVTYALDVEFKVPVPGFILKKLVKGSLPGMVKSFGARALKTN